MSGEKRFTLRMDADLFDEISKAAEKHRRSTAKEVEYAIALYLKDLAQKELLDNIDVDQISEEEAKERLKQLNKITEKYKAFLE